MFSQACVKNSVHGGGGCLLKGMLGYTPLGRHPLLPALRDTVNNRTVRILLECILITVYNEVAKVMFLQVCGVVSQHALQVVSQHALQQVSKGGGACSWGGLLPGWSARGGLWRPPERSRRLLLRTVRILLECILLANNKY